MRPKLELSRTALISNLKNYRRKTSSLFICPMVKANAYGVGDSLVVRELLNANVTDFGVARAFEGLKLRRDFPQDNFEVLVFAPLTETSISDYVQSRLTAVVGSKSDLSVLEGLDEHSRRALKKIHLNFDLGMSRLGFSFSEALFVKEFIKKTELEVGGVCGHFSEADLFSAPDSQAESSLKELIEVARLFDVKPERVHAPNTEALNFKNFEVGVRPGIGLYGLKTDHSFESALSLTAPLVQTRVLEVGDKVSYGGLWTTKVKTQIGVFAIGYADGLNRGLSGEIYFSRKKNDKKAYPQVGAICMDYTMVDLGLDVSFELGEEFTLFDGVSGIKSWCDIINCIPYEILTGLGERVERVIIE